MKPFLRAEKIEFSYGGLSQSSSFNLSVDVLDVFPGEVHTLIGPNGCGKSTLLRLISGMLQPQNGKVFLNDKNLAEMDRLEIARSVAFLPQQVSLLFDSQVEDIVLMGRYPWRKGLGLVTDEDLQIAESAISRMGVESMKGRRFDTLSGGERQRVLLASILAQQPRMILLDEPTSALDVHHQAEVFNLIRKEAERGVGILVVTHDLILGAHFSDRMTLLQSGRPILTGDVREVLQEDHLRKVYGEQLRVITDRDSGLPYVLPSAACGTHSTDKKKKSIEHKDIVPSVQTEGDSSFSPAKGVLSWNRWIGFLSTFAGLCLLAIMFAPCIGSEKINFFQAIHEWFFDAREHWSVSAQILALRFPRVCIGLLSGMALGCAGAALQSLLRNPLAEPYTLGIASTSSLGAVIALSFPALSPRLGFVSGVQVWAFAFAALGVLILWLASRRNFIGTGLSGLLLMGVTLGMFSAAIIMLIKYLVSPLTLRALDQWMVGGLEIAGWKDVFPTLPFLIPGLVLLLVKSKDLNQIGFGEDLAQGRGVNVKSLQGYTLAGCSLVTAAVVAVVGPIGFVGLIVPHIVRKLVGSDQRLVLPCSMLLGGTVLIVADTLARSISLGGRGAELPVGIFTSLVGGPVFLMLLLRQRGFR